MNGADLLPPLIGVSPAIQRVRELVDLYAPSALPVLVVGATGTGKEVVARHVHTRSGRRGRLVAVNYGALPSEMAEGLLFGHQRGAYSGAVATHRGHLEVSSGGTLFLDEIVDLSHGSQAKLLRALEMNEVQRLGAEAPRTVDLRLVAAAREDLAFRLASGAFRADLFQRLAGVVIELPPLCQRRADIVPLAVHFAGLGGRRLEPDAEAVLFEYTWPGNVRELRQVVERAGMQVRNGTLPRSAILEALQLGRLSRSAHVGPARDRSYRNERNIERVVAACAANNWHAGRTAAALGIARSTLFYRLRIAGVSLRRLRERQSNSLGSPTSD